MTTTNHAIGEDAANGAIDECIEALIDAKSLAAKLSARNQLDLAIERRINAAAPANGAMGEREAFQWPQMPDLPNQSFYAFDRALFTAHQMQGYANAYGEVVRAALTAEKVAGQEPVAHTLAGFKGGYFALNGGLPNEQEIYDAGMRAGKDLAAPQPSQPAQSGEQDERAALEWALFSLISCGHHEWAQRHRKVFEAMLARAALPQATATQPVQTERALTDEQIDEIAEAVFKPTSQRLSKWIGREFARALLTAAQPASALAEGDKHAD